MISLKQSIVPYSLKKIKTNLVEEYSTLNPLMSSLSPSTKSNGARLHSQTHLIHQRIKINKFKVKPEKVDTERDVLIKQQESV